MNQNIILKFSTSKSELCAKIGLGGVRQKNDNHLIYELFSFFFAFFKLLAATRSKWIEICNILYFMHGNLCALALCPAPCDGHKFYDFTQTQFMHNRVQCVYCVWMCLNVYYLRNRHISTLAHTQTPYFFRHPILIMRLLKSHFLTRKEHSMQTSTHRTPWYLFLENEKYEQEKKTMMTTTTNRLNMGKNSSWISEADLMCVAGTDEFAYTNCIIHGCWLKHTHSISNRYILQART